MNSFPLTLVSAWGNRKSYKRVNTNKGIMLVNIDVFNFLPTKSHFIM